MGASGIQWVECREVASCPSSTAQTLQQGITCPQIPREPRLQTLALKHNSEWVAFGFCSFQSLWLFPNISQVLDAMRALWEVYRWLGHIPCSQRTTTSLLFVAGSQAQWQTVLAVKRYLLICTSLLFFDHFIFYSLFFVETLWVRVNSDAPTK